MKEFRVLKKTFQNVHSKEKYNEFHVQYKRKKYFIFGECIWKTWKEESSGQYGSMTFTAVFRTKKEAKDFIEWKSDNILINKTIL